MKAITSLLIAAVLVTGCSSKPPITHEASDYLIHASTLNFMCYRDGNRSESAALHTVELFKYALSTWGKITDHQKITMYKRSMELRKKTTSPVACKTLDKFDDGITKAKWQREQADTAANWELAGNIFKATLTAVQIAAELAPVHTNCSEFMGNVSCTSSKGY